MNLDIKLIFDTMEGGLMFLIAVMIIVGIGMIAIGFHYLRYRSKKVHSI